MAFYVSNWCGRVMAGGQIFATQDEAIEAAKTVIRRSRGRSTHGVVAVDVVEAIPGQHVTRAIINPDLSVSVLAKRAGA